MHGRRFYSPGIVPWVVWSCRESRDSYPVKINNCKNQFYWMRRLHMIVNLFQFKALTYFPRKSALSIRFQHEVTPQHFVTCTPSWRGTNTISPASAWSRVQYVTSTIRPQGQTSTPKCVLYNIIISLTCLSIAFCFLKLFSRSLLIALKKIPSTTFICKKNHYWLKLNKGPAKSVKNKLSNIMETTLYYSCICSGF